MHDNGTHRKGPEIWNLARAYYFEGVSVTDLAAHAGQQEASIRLRLHHSVERLKVILAGWDNIRVSRSSDQLHVLEK